MTPQEAFNVLRQVARVHLCNEDDRNVINDAVNTLHAAISEPAPEATSNGHKEPAEV